MNVRDALQVMAERAGAIESAPGVIRHNDGTLTAPAGMEVAEMLLQGVDAPAKDVLRALELVAEMHGLPEDVEAAFVEVFVLGSLVGQS